MNAIPRYQSSQPIQIQFVTNADACGDHIFTQVKRSGNVCLYSRVNLQDSRHMGFEVIVLKQVKAGAPLPGGNVVKADYESYPGAQSFGRTGWSFSALSGAVWKFNDVVKDQQTKNDLFNFSNDPITTVPVAVTVKANKGNTLMMLATVTVKADNQDIPTGEFTQTQFATANSLPIRGMVYNVIQTLVNKGLIKVSRRVKMGPGRPTCLYIKA
jgi:hypothetical protein